MQKEKPKMTIGLSESDNFQFVILENKNLQEERNERNIGI